jgi:hypothetical protein
VILAIFFKTDLEIKMKKNLILKEAQEKNLMITNQTCKINQKITK